MLLSSLNWAIWVVLASCLFYVVILAYNQLLYWKRRNVPHGFDPPFVRGIGTMLFSRKSFPEMVRDMYDRFPTARYYGTINIGKPLIIIRDVELIREVCVKNFDSFTDHQTFIDASADPVFGGNVFSLKGQRWKEMRSTLSPSFTANKMKVLFQLVSQCAKDFVGYFENHPDAAASVDMKDAFTRYTTDVIATAAFGISIDSLENRENEFFMNGKSVNSNSIMMIIKFLICMIFPIIARVLHLTFLPAKTNKFFKDLISETVKVRDEKGIIRPDMIHLLMQARNKGIEMSVDDIVSQAVIFFLAGFDTSSTLMCYAAHELGYNPDIQERLRNEVEECLPSDEEVTYDTLTKMKYMDMVLNETLRKYPPVPIMDRVCTAPCKIPPGMPGYSEYTFEVGTTINIPVYAIHHDPSIYPDPEKFDPERFSDGNKDNINPCAFMSFGLGPRKCIANRFALMETKILLANILKKFVIKPMERSPHQVKFATNAFNMLAKDGFWNKLETRKKNN